MFCKTVATIQEKNGIEFGCTVKKLMKLAGVESSDIWGIKSFSLKLCAISLSFYQNRNVMITNLQTLSKKLRRISLPKSISGRFNIASRGYLHKVFSAEQ